MGAHDSPAGSNAAARLAMRISLAAGVGMLLGKWSAFWLTGSAAILADAMESVIHIVAVGFAAFSLRLSARPADSRFLFGYERVSFFSAGFEGALIILAALGIVVTAIAKWRTGLELESLGSGTLIVFGAALANALLGWYLLRTGRRVNSLIVEANGYHVLADSWTSFGVVGGLLLVLATGWKPFDPIVAIAAALHILWSGGNLMLRSLGGLMDYADPETGKRLGAQLDELCAGIGIQYHGVRFRDTGQRLYVEIHLLFPYGIALGEAHRAATRIEEELPERMGVPVDVVTHLEAMEDHGDIHSKKHHTGRPL